MSKDRLKYGDYTQHRMKPSPTGIESPLKSLPRAVSPLGFQIPGYLHFQSNTMRALNETLDEKSKREVSEALNDYDAPGFQTLGMGRLGKGKYSPTQGLHVPMLKRAYNGVVDPLNLVFQRMKATEGYDFQPLPKVDESVVFDDTFRKALLLFQHNLNLDNQEGAVGPETLLSLDAIYLMLEYRSPVRPRPEDPWVWENPLTKIFSYMEVNTTSEGLDFMVHWLESQHRKGKEKKFNKFGSKVPMDDPTEDYNTFAARAKYRERYRKTYFAVDANKYDFDADPSQLYVHYKGSYENEYQIRTRNGDVTIARIEAGGSRWRFIQFWPVASDAYFSIGDSPDSGGVTETIYELSNDGNGLVLSQSGTNEVFRSMNGEQGEARELPATRGLPRWFRHFFVQDPKQPTRYTQRGPSRP